MIRQFTFGILTATVLAMSAVAQTNRGVEAPTIRSIIATIPNDSSLITMILSTQPAIALGPPDLLKRYQEQMAAISQRTYGELAQIAEGTRQGQISREQAEYLTNQRYELGMMQFQLMNALYQSLEADVEKGEGRERAEDVIPRPAPVASADIPENWVKYLELTPAQLSAVQAEVEEQRKLIRPQLEQLANTRRALIAATRKGRFDQNEVSRLAATESRILQQLIVADARLQTNVYKLLTGEQQRKIDQLREQTVASAKPTYTEW